MIHSFIKHVEVTEMRSVRVVMLRPVQDVSRHRFYMYLLFIIALTLFTLFISSVRCKHSVVS